MLFTVKSSVANIYKKNNKKSEIITQILLGEKFITQSKFGKFYRGYRAYEKKHTRLFLKTATYIQNQISDTKQIKKYFLIQEYQF
jgi:hypothetical protein